MQHSQNDRTLALAGIYQSVLLVKDVARKGHCTDAEMSALLETLFRFDAQSVNDVYGDINCIKRGLNAIIEQLSGNSQTIDREIIQYGVSLLHLERSLSKSPDVLEAISSDLDSVASRMDYFDLSHENIIAGLAEIYQQRISPLGAKIMVQGEHVYLSQQSNANKIRALLFAGIRSAVLWRQCGGGRLQLIFSRKKYLQSAEQILNTL